MPDFDLSVDELFAYQGSSPCPKDINLFWDNALNELAQCAPEPQWVDDDFQTDFCRCSHLYFTGIGGARIHARVVQPRDPRLPRHPAVVMFHGYTANSGDWLDKLPYAAAGMTLAALDCRGQGGRSQDNLQVSGNTQCGHIIRGLDDSPEKLYYRHVFLDTVRLVNLVMALEDVDETRVGAFGGSQGGALTLACAALVPDLNRAVALHPFLSDYKRVWQMGLDQNAYAELRDYFRRFDPRHEREDEIFERLGYIDIQNLAPRIRARVQMFTGLIDEICPPSTQFAAYNKIKAPKNVTFYPDYAHEPMPGVYDWIFQFMLAMKND